MKVGIVGFPGSGKTTIFNALTSLDIPTGDYGGGKVQLGTIEVPDERIDRLVEIYSPKKITFAELTCVDIPGNHAKAQAGLDSITLQHIRDVNALALILGSYKADATTPESELESFLSELVLTDLLLLEKRIAALSKQADRKEEKALLESMVTHLENGTPLTQMTLDKNSEEMLRQYAFVSDKPIVVVVNVNEDNLNGESCRTLESKLGESGHTAFCLSGPLECELAGLEADEQREFLSELELEETARNRFIRATFDALHLITFLTAGDKEVRAWPVRAGSNARTAAGKIHTDLERGFIRAEVFHFDEISLLGSENQLKAEGKLRVEGKEYIVKDGDVMLIRHS